MSSNLTRHLQKADDIYSKSPYLWIIHMVFNYAVIALSIAASVIYDSPYVYAIAVFLIGSRMRAFMNLLHESSHHNLVPKNESVNKVIADLFCAFPILTTFNSYFESHTRHHMHFKDIQKDPDMMRYAEVFGKQFVKTKQDVNFLQVVNLWTFIKYSYYFPLKNFLNSNIMEYKIIFLFWTIVIYAAYSFGVIDYLLLYWLIPYLTAYKIISYSAELFEHAGIYANTSVLNTTRNIYTNNLIAYLFWPHGDNYHLTHHLLATVPGYNLKKVSAYLIEECPEFRDTHASYSI